MEPNITLTNLPKYAYDSCDTTQQQGEGLSITQPTSRQLFLNRIDAR